MEKQSLQKNALEWIVFAGGCVLVLGIICYLAVTAATLGNSPPDIKIILGKPQPEGEYYHVPVTVRNAGDQTAEGVLVEVELQPQGKEKETAEFEAAFLPRHSQREGAVIFKSDPRQGKLATRVLGYAKP